MIPGESNKVPPIEVESYLDSVQTGGKSDGPLKFSLVLKS